MGVVSDLVSGFTGMAQQSQDNHAAAQDTGAAGSAFSAATGGDNSLMQSYFGSGGGGQMLQSLLSSLSGSGGLGSTYTNPYASGAQGIGNTLGAGGGNANMTSAQGSAAQLQNFNGLKPQELAALQTTLGNSGQQTINTLRGQLGGTANPGATIQGLMGQNQQNTLNAGVQLGGQAAGQELSAQQSAGQLYSGLSGQNIGAMSEGGSLLSGLSGQNLSYYGDQLQGLLTGLGQQQSGAQYGIGNLGGIGNTYMGAASGASQAGAQAGQQSANSFGQFGNALTGVLSGTGSLFG